ncbi:hypothetical protein [uncultured Croceicoccus sp.]|uniref:hypothetical protein n=1 Tax=uncultured Croceicoccus sp. TaxID=1295329 RepID=UPI0026331E61|nr:hypothetical protein [uncultured Croceicoccus sp.]
MSAAADRRFDPANDVHFGISEEAHYRAVQAGEGLRTVAFMIERIDLDELPAPLAPLLHTLADAMGHALNDGDVVFPKRAK